MFNFIENFIIKSYPFRKLKGERDLLQAKYNKLIDDFRALDSAKSSLSERHSASLREEKDFYNNRTEELRADLKASRKLVIDKQAIIDGYVFSDITAIKFTAHVPNVGWNRAEFKLGIGPCGKEVTALHWAEKDDRYELTQTCTDGERKEFTYYKKDVAGRIEIAYKVSN